MNHKNIVKKNQKNKRNCGNQKIKQHFNIKDPKII